jgi:hypothetical protein
MSSNTLPPVLRTAPLKRADQTTQDINTDLLFPVVFNQKSVKFVFDRKGVLSANSQLHLAQIVVNSQFPAYDTNSFLPTSTGALAMIDRAYLTIGGKRVSDLQQVGQYNTWKHLHYSNEYRKGVQQPKQGTNDVFMGSTDPRIAPASATAIRARGFQPPYGQLGREASEYAIATSSSDFAEQQADRTATTDRPKRLLTKDPATTPTFSIGLSQLIPFMVGVNLPLFAIKEEVALHIEWAGSGYGQRFMWNRYNTNGDDLNDVNQYYKQSVSTIVEDECFIMADYLYFPQQMEAIEDQIMNSGGYDIPYDDVATQENFTTYATGDFTNEYQIVMGGKKVKRIIVQKEWEGLKDFANCSLYNSTELADGCSYQFKIDSQNVYSLPLRNRALQKAETDLVEGIPLVMCDYLYSFKNNVDATGAISTNTSGITDRLCNSHLQRNEAGTQNWIGVKLENSQGQAKRLSNQPIIYTETGECKAVNNGSERKVRFFCLYQKLVNISGGLVHILE